jgi:hypothetical protein
MKNSAQTIILCVILLLQIIFLWASYDNKAPIKIDSILTIIGWLAIYFIGIKQFKNQKIVNKKIDIYGELTKLRESLDEAFIFQLIVFIKYFRIFEIDIKERGPELLKYSKDLSARSFDAHKSFQKFHNCISAWISLMPKLEKTEVILSKEYYKFLDKTYKLKDEIDKYALSTNEKEQKERREKIEKIINNIESNEANIINYINDFMELVSDELTFPVFRHKLRSGIENLKEGQIYKKLTINGIKEVPYKPKDFQNSQL